MRASGAAPAGATPDEAAREVRRVVDRLRSMPLTRLAGHAPTGRALAQRLADRAADLGGWPRRPVPDAGDAAAGDQVAVTAADLLALDPPEDVLAPVIADVREVRLSL